MSQNMFTNYFKNFFIECGQTQANCKIAVFQLEPGVQTFELLPVRKSQQVYSTQANQWTPHPVQTEFGVPKGLTYSQTNLRVEYPALVQDRHSLPKTGPEADVLSIRLNGPWFESNRVARLHAELVQLPKRQSIHHH